MLLSTLLVWGHFAAQPHVLYRHFDGPFYMAVARTFYSPTIDTSFLPLEIQDPAYLATHLPLYPLLIRLCTLFTLGRYPEAMILATLLSSIVAAVLFLRLLEKCDLVASPLWTAVLFAILPPRFLIYHCVGASEPLFLCCVFAAFLAFFSGSRAQVLIAILLASLTRVVGILLVPVFVLAYLRREDLRSAALVPLAGIGLLLLFLFYSVRYGDFFAYFSWNQGHEHLLSFVPFLKFQQNAGVGDFQRAEYGFWTYSLYGLGTLLLFKRRPFFDYCLLLFVLNCFVVHLDVARYMIPIAPFALLVALDPVLGRREARFGLPVLVLLSLLYAWGWLPRALLDRSHYEALLRLLSS
jgi:hypothetical protein